MSDRIHTTGNPIYGWDWLGERLLCYFDFYDRPLSGLCLVAGVYHYFSMVSERDDNGEINYESPDLFEVWEVDWTPENQEFLEDYLRYYGDCFHENWRRVRHYDPATNPNLAEFSEKWQRSKWPIRPKRPNQEGMQ